MQNPNGIAIGPDGGIFVATTGRIVRVDPDTGGQDIIAEMPGNSFDGITFSNDFDRLYFNEEFGQIHFVDFDADRTPSEPRTGARIPLGVDPFSILDGMAVDACGNLYVTEMNGTIWRVLAEDGTIEEIASLGGLAVTPALNFGIAPIGGWSETALYVITFTGTLFELDIGVPGKWEPHL